MKNILKFIKKHSHIIVGVIIIIFIVILAILVKNFFFPNEGGVYYGNRLEGIEKVKITDTKKSEIKQVFNDSSKSINVRVAGRIIYIDVKVNDDTSVDTSRDLANKVLEKFTDEEKSYYDIQFMIGNDSNENQFPILGYKHHTKPAISWTKNR